MLFTKFLRGMAAGALALAALGAHAHAVQNTPLEKIDFQSATCAPAHEAQVLDAPEENAFVYGECASGSPINPYKYTDPDGRQSAPNVYPNFEPMQYLKDLAVESVKFIAMAAGGAGGTAVKGVEALGVAAKVVEGATAAKVVANAVPSTMARVVPNGVPVATLGKPGAGDVFVTAAQDIAGMNSSQIATRLTIPESQTGFKVIEFATPKSGVASPVLRTNPGFVGGGKTAGGAREFVIPNGPTPADAVIRTVP